MTKPKLGILAGAGSLPSELVAACESQGREVFVLGFENACDVARIAHVPHAVVRLGAVGEALAHLRSASVEEVVLAGGIKRPPLFSLKPDKMGTKLISYLGAAFFSGDDALLTALTRFLGDEGFRVISAQDVQPESLSGSGPLSKYAPSDATMRDIEIGLYAAKMLGKEDIGQAVIVEAGTVLGTEDAEGTEALIVRSATLKREQKRAGVLVKVSKPGQEKRADLPAIGPDTITQLHAANFEGVAVESNSSLILERAKTLALADELGLFVYGLDTNDV